MSQRCARQDSGARRVRHTELWLIHSGITMLAIVMAVPTQDVNMVHINCMAPTLTDNSQQQTGCVDCPSRHGACSRVCSLWGGQRTEQVSGGLGGVVGRGERS